MYIVAATERRASATTKTTNGPYYQLRNLATHIACRGFNVKFDGLATLH